MSDLPSREAIAEKYEQVDARLDLCVTLKRRVEMKKAEYEPLEDALEDEIAHVRQQIRDLEEQLELLEQAQDGTWGWNSGDKGPSIKALAMEDDEALQALIADLEAAEQDYKVAYAEVQEMEAQVTAARLEKREPKDEDELRVWLKVHLDEVNGLLPGGQKVYSPETAKVSATGRPYARFLDGTGLFRIDDANVSSRYGTSEKGGALYARIGFKGQLLGVLVSINHTESEYYGSSSWTEVEYYGLEGQYFDADNVRALVLDLSKEEAEGNIEAPSVEVEE